MIRNKNVRVFAAVALSLTIFTIAVSAKETMADAERARKNVREDVQKIVLPTDAEAIFDFIVDPQQVINETNGAAYDGQTFEEDTTLFFKRSDGEAEEDYSSTSDAVKIVNKGETEVEVVLTAKMVSLGGIQMTDDRKFRNDTDASLYLALTDGEELVPIDSDRGAEIRAKIPAAGDGDNTYLFRLTGVANKKGDWGGLTDANPKVIVTWKIVLGEAEKEELDVSEVSDELKAFAESETDGRDDDEIWTTVTPTEPEQ